MTEFDSMVANFQHMKALEFRDRIPTKLEATLELPDKSCFHAIKFRFEETKELEFERIYQRPIGRRCFKEFVMSKKEIELEPKSEKLLLFLEQVEHIGKQPEQAKIKGYRKSTRNKSDSVSSKQQTDTIYKNCIALIPDATIKLWDNDEVVERCHKLYNALDDNPKLSTLKGVFSEMRTEAMKFLQEGSWKRFLASSHFVRYCQWKQLELNLDIGERDFMVTRILGSGGFGEVHGCRKKDTGTIFAMKQLDKKRLKLKNCESLAIEERNILAQLNSKFTTNLKYAFQDKHMLYLVMELMDGGDLSFHLKKAPKGVFTEHQAQFYTAEISLGLAHMHSVGIVYRDVKPANILLDAKGHARISDMGLARHCVDHLTSASGTHGYMAPEVINPGSKYGKSSDWFSLGCTCFEFLTGRFPFLKVAEFESKKRPSKAVIDERTLSNDFITYPENLSQPATNLLQALLEHEPASRLGGSADHCESNHKLISSHPWFDDLDWQALREHKVSGALKPSAGQVNAAEINDIATLRGGKSRKIKLTKEDDTHYHNFHRIMSHQWQTEVLPMFEMISETADKLDLKRTKNIESSAKDKKKIADEQYFMQGYMQVEVMACKSLKWVTCYVELHKTQGVVIRKEQHQPIQTTIPYTSCEFEFEMADTAGDFSCKTLLVIQLKDDVRLRPRHQSDGPVWCKAIDFAISETTGRKNPKMQSIIYT